MIQVMMFLFRFFLIISGAVVAWPATSETLLFMGSSTIANWQPTLREQFPDYRPVAEGKGGSDFPWLIQTARAFVRKHNPDRVVIYSGDNDLANRHSPETVATHFSRTVQLIREEKKDLPIYVLAIKPSPGRKQWIAQVKEANSLIRLTAKKFSRVHYVDTFPSMMDPKGEIIESHFDPTERTKIHLSRQGYELWTTILTKQLKAESP